MWTMPLDSAGILGKGCLFIGESACDCCGLFHSGGRSLVLGINPTVGPGTSYDDMNSGKIAWDRFQGGVQFHWQTGDSSVLPCIA